MRARTAILGSATALALIASPATAQQSGNLEPPDFGPGSGGGSTAGGNARDAAGTAPGNGTATAPPAASPGGKDSNAAGGTRTDPALDPVGRPARGTGTNQPGAGSSGPRAPGSRRTSGSDVVTEETRKRAAKQNKGEFAPLKRESIAPLGMTQDAWTAPRKNEGSGQKVPGTVVFDWTPRLIMPIRIRENMITTISLPEWEKAKDVYFGTRRYFSGKIVRDNAVMIKTSQPGVDTTLNIIGSSGNNYTFYVRAESFNTERITDLQVIVNAAPASEKREWFRAHGGLGGTAPHPDRMSPDGGSDGFNLPGSPRVGNQPESVGDARGDTNEKGDDHSGAHSGAESTKTSVSGTANDTVAGAEFYIPREEMRFPYKMYAVEEGDSAIAPKVVYTNGRFTFFHYGRKAATVTRPIVRKIVNGVETTVNTRWIGDHNEVLVAESTGKFVLRNGGRTVCVLPKQDHLRDPGQSVVPDNGRERQKAADGGASSPTGGKE